MALCLQPSASPFEPPSFLYRLLSSPLKCLTQHLYALILFLRGPSYTIPTPDARIRLVCISDTHSLKATSMPMADVLIHAGDLSNRGTVSEIQDQIDWLSSLPYRHKIAIAGNHDSHLDPRSRRSEDGGRSVDWRDIKYLQHSTFSLSFPDRNDRQLNFHGAPQIPRCGGDDFAFQYPRGRDAWSDTIPKDTDVLITHTPPKHHLDLPRGMGCEHLLRELWSVKPKIHVFGHVHAGYGQEYVFWDQSQILYEDICDRKEQGLLQDAVDVRAWVKVVRLTICGIVGIIWSRIWGGEDDAGGVLVNAALTYRSTGELRNTPRVVDI